MLGRFFIWTDFRKLTASGLQCGNLRIILATDIKADLLLKYYFDSLLQYANYYYVANYPRS